MVDNLRRNTGWDLLVLSYDGVGGWVYRDERHGIILDMNGRRAYQMRNLVAEVRRSPSCRLAL
jgi:hypothetical protein